MFSSQAIKLIIFSLFLGLNMAFFIPVLAEDYDFIGINESLLPDNISENLSMYDAIKMAIINNPKVVIERADIEEKIASVDESKSYLYPQIYFKQDFIASNNPVQAFMMKLGQRNFNLGTANLNYPGSECNFSTRIGAKVTLIDRTLYSNIDIKKVELELQKQIGKVAIFDLVKDVRKSFLDVQFAKERVNNAQSTINAANSHYKAVVAKKEVGMASKSDLLGAKVTLSNAKEGLLKSKNDLNLAWITLADILGDDNIVGLDLNDKMESDYIVDSVDKLVKYAFLHRPEIIEVEMFKDKSLKDLTLAKRTGSMTLDVLGEWGVDTILDDNNIARSYTAAVFLNKSLFDGGLRRSKIKKAQAGIEKSDAKIDQVYKQIKLEVVQNYLSFVNSKERLTMTEDLVNDAEESLRAYNERFAVGISNGVEVENAQAKLSDARLLRAHSLYDLKYAVIGLQRAMGMSLDSILSGKGLLIQDQVELKPPVSLKNEGSNGDNSNQLDKKKDGSDIKHKDNTMQNVKPFSFLDKSTSSASINTNKSELQDEHSFLDEDNESFYDDIEIENAEVIEEPPAEDKAINKRPDENYVHSFLDDVKSDKDSEINKNEIIEITPDLSGIKVDKKMNK